MPKGAWNEGEERGLVIAASAGDLAAYDLLVRRYRKPALTVATAVLGRRELAEDAVQDALLAAFAALPRLGDPERFGPWLATIVRNRAQRLARGERRATVPLDAVVLAYSPAISERLEENERGQAVRSAVDGLPEELRPVVALYYLDEWPVAEIARFLGLPPTTVKWRLHAGRQQLRGLLSERLEN